MHNLDDHPRRKIGATSVATKHCIAKSTLRQMVCVLQARGSELRKWAIRWVMLRKTQHPLCHNH